MIDRSNKRKFLWRLGIMGFIFSLFIGAIIARLVKLQIIDYDFYKTVADKQHKITKTILPLRGIIYWQSTRLKDAERYLENNLSPVATNKNFYLLYAQPYLVDDPEQAANKLVEVFIPAIKKEPGKNDVLYQTNQEQRLKLYTKFFERLNKENDPYEPLENKVSEEIRDQVMVLGLKGVDVIEETWRFYPKKNLGSGLLGFVNYEGKGQYGLEEYFNQELSGEKGVIKTDKDVGGGLISLNEKEVKQAVDGASLVLTIDDTIESVACEKLDQAIKEYAAESGSIIMMEPSTGAIIAMCGFPDYDPNNYGEAVDINNFNNSAIFSDYEPGSVFKPITMSMALDQGKVTPETTYNDVGTRMVDGFPISNYDHVARGTQTMTNVLESSLNLGAMYAAEQVGVDKFRDYLTKYGFGMNTGIELETEAAGNVSSLKNKQAVYLATASFGQGITVTPLQMITAFSAIVNNGVLMKPYIIDRIIYSNGKIDKVQPKTIRQVVSARSATLLRGMLVSVVEKGHAKFAKVQGYYVGGKTGTAQVPDKKNGGYTNDTIHSFVAFAPATNPRFSMIIQLVKPKNAHYAETTTTYMFSDLSKFILNYYKIPPDR